MREYLATKTAKLLEKAWSRSKGLPPITFHGKSHPVLAKLGHGVEGDVYLIRSGDRFAVIKKFNVPEQLTENAALMRSLAARKLEIAEVIDTDPASASMMLTYAEGITFDDVQTLAAQGKLDAHVAWMSYLYLHALYAKAVVRDHAEEVTRSAGLASGARGADGRGALLPHYQNVVL